MIKLIIGKLIKIFRAFETGSLIFFMSLMIIVSAAKIILPLLPSKLSISWLEAVLRYCLLWVGMIAASMAVIDGKHIKIDVVGKFVKGRIKLLINSITSTFTGAVCLIISVAFVLYILKIEIDIGKYDGKSINDFFIYILSSMSEPPPFLGIPKWTLLSILPFSFFTMGIRFFIRAIMSAVKFAKNVEEVEKDEFMELMQQKQEKEEIK